MCGGGEVKGEGGGGNKDNTSLQSYDVSVPSNKLNSVLRNFHSPFYNFYYHLAPTFFLEVYVLNHNYTTGISIDF